MKGKRCEEVKRCKKYYLGYKIYATEKDINNTRYFVSGHG